MSTSFLDPRLWLDGQAGGGTRAEAIAADLHMGCLYVTRLRRLSTRLFTISPLIHFPNFLMVRCAHECWCRR
jgi:hypothetical protein